MHVDLFISWLHDPIFHTALLVAHWAEKSLCTCTQVLHQQKRWDRVKWVGGITCRLGAVHIVAAGLAIKGPWLVPGGQILMNELRK